LNQQQDSQGGRDERWAEHEGCSTPNRSRL
jgi:hypothetical protein